MDQAEINAVLYGEREPIHSDRLPWPMNALIEALIGGGGVSHLADKTGLARIGAIAAAIGVLKNHPAIAGGIDIDGEEFSTRDLNRACREHIHAIETESTDFEATLARLIVSTRAWAKAIVEYENARVHFLGSTIWFRG
jgi:hypothetical protein